MIKRALLVVAAFLITGQAVAQSVQQSGNVTRGHVAEWVASGIIQDGGTATSPNISSLGIYGYGGTPFCITDTTSPGTPSGNYGQLCFGINASGAYMNTATYGAGSAIPFQFNINGSSVLTLSATGAAFNPIALGGSGSGTTTLSSANSSSTNYTVTFPIGSGYNLESVNTVPVVTGTPTSSTYLRGDGQWATPAGAGTVSGPNSSTNGYVPTWNGTSGTALLAGNPLASTATANALVQANSSGVVDISFVPFVPANFFSGLKIVAGSSTTLTVAASAVTMTNASGAGLSKPLSSTVSISSTGLNALDTGTVAASTWYYVWAVSNGTTTGVVLSTSSATPNAAITATYPYYARVGAVRVGGSSVLVSSIQYGRTAQYINNGSVLLPTMASGSAGSISTPTYVSFSVASYVPTTASRIAFIAFGSGATETAVAPNGSYGSVSSTTNQPPFQSQTANSIQVPAWLTLESTNLYWASNSASNIVQCLGWEDNI